MDYFVIFNIIYCSKQEKNKLFNDTLELTKKDTDILDLLNKNESLYSTDKEDNIRHKRGFFYSASMYKPLPKAIEISKCREHSKFKYINFDLELINVGAIYYISYTFYEILLKHPIFVDTCKKIGINIKEDLPSKDTFRKFIFKFITREKITFKKTKASYFVMSIAKLAYNHIVHWSQTHLIGYSLDDWMIVWDKIFNSIDISTDKLCYWRVEKLFDQTKILEVDNHLNEFEIEKFYDSTHPGNTLMQYLETSYDNDHVPHLQALHTNGILM